MNKKLFLGMFAAAGMLLATSCQNDELDAVQAGNEATVSFTLGVEGGVQTRAISDGLTADRLVYAVFGEDGQRITTIAKVDKTTTFPTTENITLAKGQTYKVAFWAQNSATGAYVLDDDMNLTVCYEGLNNEEDRDAFFKTVEVTVTGNQPPVDVVLKRPFAQLNVGVTEEDWNVAVASGIEIATSKVVIKNVATEMNLVDGTVNDQTKVEVTYDFGATPKSSGEILSVDLDKDGMPTKYNYLSMSYILVGEDKENLDEVEFTFRPTESTGNDIVFNTGLNNVPVQRNWRTNIIGQILTGDVTFNIDIDPIYDGEWNNGTPYPVLLNNVYYETIEEALAVAVDGDEIHLAVGEYTLPSSMTLKDNAEGTITFVGAGENTVLNGKFIYAYGLDVKVENLTYETPNDGYDSGFAHAASVSFENCHIVGQYYAQSWATHTFTECTIDPLNGYIYTYGANCTFDGCTFNSSNGKALQVYSETGEDEAANLKESTVTIKNCTFTATKTASTWDGKPVTAIDINSIWNNKFNVNITNTTATGYATGLYSENSLWNIKGGEDNVTIFVDGKNIKDAIEVNGVKYPTLTAALADVAAGTPATIKLTEGTYTIPSNAQGKTLTFVGTGSAANTVIECKTVGSDNLNGSEVTFENLTIETDDADYRGFIHIKNPTYKNCIIKNQFTLYESAEDNINTFENCTFYAHGNRYNLWTWGVDATFKDCEFHCDGKAVLVYGGGTSTVTFDGCVFNDFGGVDGKAAIETGNDYDATYTININTCEVNGFDVNAVSGSNVWGNKNNMTADKLNVFIDGTEVY